MSSYKILLLSETNLPDRRPTCLMRDPDMLHLRSICNPHAPSENDMPDQRRTFLETHWRPTFLIETRPKPTYLIRVLTLL